MNKFQPNPVPSSRGNRCSRKPGSFCAPCATWAGRCPHVAKHHTFWFLGFNFTLPFGATVLAGKKLHIPSRVSPGVFRKQERSQNFSGLIHFSEVSFPPLPAFWLSCLWLSQLITSQVYKTSVLFLWLHKNSRWTDSKFTLPIICLIHWFIHSMASIALLCNSYNSWKTGLFFYLFC